MLEELAEPQSEPAGATDDVGGEAGPAASSSSLGIGSLRGQT
jgi:hypothetical protein